MSEILAQPTPGESYFNLRFAGYVLDAWGEQGGRAVFKLKPASDRAVCPDCGRLCDKIHDTRVRRVAYFDAVTCEAVRLEMPVRRVRCSCGCRKTEPAPAWIKKGTFITARLAAFAQRLLRLRMTVKDVAAVTGLSWNQVKDLDKEQLAGTEKSLDLSRMEHIAIDEISIHKGHKYATVAMDIDSRVIFWAAEGKAQDDVQPLFDMLKARGLDKNIKSVSVDMNAAYPALVQHNLPGATIAYDLFHVVKNFIAGVLVEAKKWSIKKARAAFGKKPALKRTQEERQAFDRAVKNLAGAEWLVATNIDLLSEGRKARLEALREDNKLFRDLYPVLEQVRQIWKQPDKQAAAQQLHAAIDLCEAIADEHDFKPVRRFAKMLKRRWHGIVSAGAVGFGTAALEGANNRAKVIKRIAYGFRDFEYFRLKLIGSSIKTAPAKKASAEKVPAGSIDAKTLSFGGVTIPSLCPQS